MQTVIQNRQQKMQAMLELNEQKHQASRAMPDILKLPASAWRQDPTDIRKYEATLPGKNFTLILSQTHRPEALIIRSFGQTIKLPVGSATSPHVAMSSLCGKLYTSIEVAARQHRNLAADELSDPARIREMATAGPNRLSLLINDGKKFTTSVGIKDSDGAIVSFSISASRMPYSAYGKSQVVYMVEAKARSQFGGLHAVEIRNDVAKDIYNRMEAVHTSAKKN